MEIKVTGFDELNARLAAMAQDLRQQAADALKAQAESILEDAKSRVPVKTGALRDSGKIETNANGDVTVAFGEGLDYAIRVHEDLEAHHVHGEAKFLERALLERAGDVTEQISDGVKKALGG